MTKEHGGLFRLLDDTEEIVRKTSGMPLKIPRPTKSLMEASAKANVAFGIGLTVYGLLSPHKWTIILGAAGIASSIFVRDEAKKM